METALNCSHPTLITQVQTGPCPLSFSTLAHHQVGWIQCGSMAQFGNFNNYFHRLKTEEPGNNDSIEPYAKLHYTPARTPTHLQKKAFLPQKHSNFQKTNYKRDCHLFSLSGRFLLAKWGIFWGVLLKAHILGLGFGWVASAVLQAILCVHVACCQYLQPHKAHS